MVVRDSGFPVREKQVIIHQYILSDRINFEIFRCEEMLCQYDSELLQDIEEKRKTIDYMRMIIKIIFIRNFLITLYFLKYT